MQKYQKTYFTGMGYNLKNVKSGLMDLCSEVSGKRGEEIHHIHEPAYYCQRQNYPVERLIMLTMDEHRKYGDKKQYFDWLMWTHYIVMLNRKVQIDTDQFYVIFPKEQVYFEEMYSFYTQVWGNKLVSEIDIQQYSVSVSVHSDDGKLITSAHADTKIQCIIDINNKF